MADRALAETQFYVTLPNCIYDYINVLSGREFNGKFVIKR